MATRVGGSPFEEIGYNAFISAVIVAADFAVNHCITLVKNQFSVFCNES